MSSSLGEAELIDSIGFGLFDPEVFRQYSVCEITEPMTVENGQPIENGLSDPRLGTISAETTCATCSQDSLRCPGHFGHIKLAEPCVHIGYATFVYKILQIVCHHCGRLRVDYNDPELIRIVKSNTGKSRLLAVHDHVKSTKLECKIESKKVKVENNDARFWKIINGSSPFQEHRRQRDEACGKLSPKITMDKEYTFHEESTGAGIKASDILHVLSLMSDQDIRVLGFDPLRSHPKFMITTVLPVPPPQVRPPVSSPGSPRPSQDDVTHHLSSIIKANNAIKKQIEDGQPASTLNESLRLLQHLITTYFINSKPSIKKAQLKNGRPIRVISERLKGKTGHIRGHLSGKRTDFSARSVISPDPSISVDELGVPIELSKILTFPEIVNSYNIDYLKGVVSRGPDAVGGANSIESPAGLLFRLPTSVQIEPGWKVNRHIHDGDLVIFNRQPSLHKMSMMGHKVSLMSGSTFRLNLSVTTPYNADFDGDEMNMHVPQTQAARAEVKHIMAVPWQIVSPQANQPVIGLVQDSLLGCRLMTFRDTFLTREQMMNLMMWIYGSDSCHLPPPAILMPKQLWTGKQVFSLFLPKINLEGQSMAADKYEDDDKWLSYNDTRVIIRKGHLISGILDKNTVARGEKGLIHVVTNQYSVNIARDFLNQAQLVVNNWLESRGFSIGLSDCVTYKATLDHIAGELDNLKTSVNEKISDALSGNLQPSPGMSLKETFESNVNKILNDFTEAAGKLVKENTKRNNQLIHMFEAGSKGSLINVSQIIASVGQQNVEGKRIRFGFKNRTLPHYTKDDLGLEARGFCEHGYLVGLSPPEFFFHAMGGRVGIIDTACKTSDTGYIQRRLCKSMESHTIAYDGTVRNSQNQIVQFVYGGDGFDATTLENLDIDLISMNDRRFRETYYMDIDNPNFGSGYMEKRHIDELKSNPSAKEALDMELERLKRFRTKLRTEIFPKGPERVALPINIKRLLQTARQNYSINQHVSISTLRPLEVIKKVHETIKSLVTVKGDDEISRKAQSNSTLLLRILLYSNLSAKQLIYEHRLNDDAINYVLGEIVNQFNHATISPGEMVGTIAGQSIGEPTTQMTLNTFHFAGVSSKDVTLGVPRLNEIMNLAENIKTPRVTIYLNEDIAGDSDVARSVLASIQHTDFKSIVRQAEIFYDPDPQNRTVVIEDQRWLTSAFESEDTNVKELSPWVLRFELDQKELDLKKLTLPDIKQAIHEVYPRDVLFITHSDQYAPIPIIRIRFATDYSNDSKIPYNDDQKRLKLLETNMYYEITLKGIPGIKRVSMEKDVIRIKLDPVTGAFEKKKGSPCEIKENVLYTEGSALSEILCQENIDTTRTLTNNVWEIYNVLGVEAALQTLYREMWLIIDSSGSKINKRHLLLLADTMTMYGDMRPVSRHGINRNNTGPMMKASYEQTLEVLFEAGAFAQVDYIKDMSSAIIVGRPSRAGTGMVDILVHEEMLPAVASDESAFQQMHTSMASPTALSPVEIPISPASTQMLIVSPTENSDYQTNNDVMVQRSPYQLASPMIPSARPVNFSYVMPSPNIGGNVYGMDNSGYAQQSPLMMNSPMIASTTYNASPRITPGTFSPASPALGYGTFASPQPSPYQLHSPALNPGAGSVGPQSTGLYSPMNYPSYVSPPSPAYDAKRN